MLKTVLIIVLSVAFFGVIFFLYVKKKLKDQLDYYLLKNNKKIKNKKYTNFFRILQIRLKF